MIKKIKEKKGVTLVALIITMIVLLILTVVAISTIKGNGIILHAKNAVNLTQINKEKETIEIAVLQSNKFEKDYIQKELDNAIGNGKTKVEEDGKYILVEFLDTNRNYEVDANGNIRQYDKYEDSTPGVLSGEGTLENPYKIESIEDLVALSIATNGGNSKLKIKGTNYLKEYIILTRNLDFASKRSYSDYTTTIYNEYLESENTDKLINLMTSGKGYKPIGTFNGYLDGKGYEIKGIYINSESEAAFIINKAGGTISNLTLSGNISGFGAAGFVRKAGVGSGAFDIEIINCVNKCNINSLSNGSAYMNAGGIVNEIGYWNKSTKVSNCKNYGKITLGNDSQSAWHGKVGGIIGSATNGATSIINCENNGEIIAYINGTLSNAGGIVGNIKKVNILNCGNTGSVTVLDGKDSMVGGITGSAMRSTIANSYNTGNIFGGDFTGGIVGDIKIEENTEMKIQNVYNLGKLDKGENSSNFKGGIAARIYGTANIVILENCYCVEGENAYYSLITPAKNLTYLFNRTTGLDDLLKNLNNNIGNNLEWNKWNKSTEGYPVFEK